MVPGLFQVTVTEHDAADRIVRLVVRRVDAQGLAAMNQRLIVALLLDQEERIAQPRESAVRLQFQCSVEICLRLFGFR